MCLILHTSKGVTPKDELLEAAYTNNKHGFGIFFPTKAGKIHAHKILPKTFDDVLSTWRQYKDASVEKGLHFRFKTVGEIERSNSHPFRVLTKATHGREIWLMHNGTIHNAPEIIKDRSDTWHFVNYLLRPILAESPDLITDTDFQRMLGDMIGKDRMLLLDGETGTFIRINSTSIGAHERDGMWLSNNYGLSARVTKKLPTVPNYLEDNLTGMDYYGGVGSARTPAGGNVVPINAKEKALNVSCASEPKMIGSTYNTDKAGNRTIKYQYAEGGELLLTSKVVSSLKQDQTKHVYADIELTVENTGTIELVSVGLRGQPDRMMGPLFNKVSIKSYEVEGDFLPNPVVGAATLYLNDRLKTDMQPGDKAVVTLKLHGYEFSGTKRAFMDLPYPNLQHVSLTVGYTFSAPTKPKPTSNIPLVEKAKTAVVEAATINNTPFEIDEIDQLTFMTDEDLDMLRAMSDEELRKTIQEHPEPIAELLRDYLDQ